jgi:hypothetical protein
MVKRAPGWAALAAGLTACGAPTWGAFVPIVSADAWRAWEGEDPFGQPGDRACDPAGYGLEDLAGAPAFQVQTGLCDWVTVAQATEIEVRRRDRFDVRVFHEALIGAAGTAATVGVAIDDEVVWRAEVPIPADSGFLLPELELKRELPVGTVLLFHVDNHGANSYHLIDIGVSPRE